jgi:hypothetical protein
MAAIEYEIGEELDDLKITWLDPLEDGSNIRDFSSGWTFEFKLGVLDSAAVLTKTTGITGAATAPNIIIAFAPEELVVAKNTYTGQLRARRTSDSKDLVTQFDMTIKAVVT